MANKLETLQDRLQEIIKTSYRLLCNKIVGGLIEVDNEASLQLQLGVIMRTIGQMYEFSPKDRFSVVLEHVVRDETIQTCKSKGKARIDVMLTLTSGNKTCTAAIELKYFPKTDGETITDNRFSMLADIENLETYLRLGKADLGYFMLYTTNKNYTTDSRSGVKIGNEDAITGEIASNNRIVNLTGAYKLQWDTYNMDKHCFLLQEIHQITNYITTK